MLFLIKRIKNSIGLKKKTTHNSCLQFVVEEIGSDLRNNNF